MLRGLPDTVERLPSLPVLPESPVTLDELLGGEA